MAKSQEKTWSAIKAELGQFDRPGLLGLVKDLYALRPENRAFIAARLGVGGDPLAPYRKAISRWIYPDLMKGQDISVSNAKKAIADYRKAVGKPEGVAELCVFYCEEATRLVGDCGIEDETYYAALVRMFDDGLTRAIDLPDADRNRLLERLDTVRGSLRDVGWGVSDAVNELWYDRVE
jgi:hypothetical protein